MKGWLLAALVVAAILAAATAAPVRAGRPWTLAYSTDDGVYVEALGSRAHRIRSGAGFQSVLWSPDGRWLAYTTWTGGGVFVMNAAGTEWWRVTRADAWPAWSPDGRWIVAVGADGVHVVSLDGSVDRRIAGADCRPGWAGRSIVLACGRRLVQASLDGRLRILNRPPADGKVAWVAGSADGSEVAFGRRCYTALVGGDVYCEIAVERLAGGARRTLVPYRWGELRGAGDAPVWIPGSDAVLVSEWGFAHAVLRVDTASAAAAAVRRRAELVLAAAADGSFAVLDGWRVLVCSPQGRVEGRFAVPRLTNPDRAAILAP